VRDPCRVGGAGDDAGLFDFGRGDTARRCERPRGVPCAGDGLSRISTESRFMDEKGVFVLTVPLGVEDPPARSLSRAAAAGFGALAAA
jgi:hypothetical protein